MVSAALGSVACTPERFVFNTVNVGAAVTIALKAGPSAPPAAANVIMSPSPRKSAGATFSTMYCVPPVVGTMQSYGCSGLLVLRVHVSIDGKLGVVALPRPE